jgi:DNA-3-methyladenine glycosylase I
MNDGQLLSVFLAIEADVLTAARTQRSAQYVRDYLAKFENVRTDLRDDELYARLVDVVFYSGFKAETVDAKRPRIRHWFPDVATVARYGERDVRKILADDGVIRHERKVRACITNARKFEALARAHGSVRAYLDAFDAAGSLKNLLRLRDALQRDFAFLGGITVYHFLMDIGLPVLKPDRVICRLFARLGLIASASDHAQAIEVGRRISQLTQRTRHPRSIRYVDRILVAHGQTADTEHGFGSALCVNIPRCGECSARQACPQISITGAGKR